MPDCGSYQVAEASIMQSHKPKAPQIKFSKMENERFMTVIAKRKAFIPGTGNYEVEPCYKKLSRPPSASRRRR
jgi:hypothetical protein